jgi:hypothetical protein
VKNPLPNIAAMVYFALPLLKLKKKKPNMKLKTMEKIRRCREHVARMEGSETCPFLEHDKNNKIEEMSEQEAEILD